MTSVSQLSGLAPAKTLWLHGRLFFSKGLTVKWCLAPDISASVLGMSFLNATDVLVRKRRSASSSFSTLHYTILYKMSMRSKSLSVSRDPWHSDPQTHLAYDNIAFIYVGQKVFGPMLDHQHTVLLASRIYWLFVAFAATLMATFMM